MTLHIPFMIWQKLRLYTELSLPNEVTGIGTVQVVDPEHLLVTEIFLPYHKTSPGDCEFADGELNQIMYDLIERDPEHGASELRFRWHSHGYGNVFWSGKDENDINDWDASWVVNLVMNARGEYLARLDYFEPLRIREHPVTLQIDYPEELAIRAACQQELQQKQSVILPPVFGQLLKKEVSSDGLFGSTQDL